MLLPWAGCSMSWSGDDPDPVGRSGVAGDRAHGLRKGFASLSLQVQEVLAARSVWAAICFAFAAAAATC